MPPCTAAKFGSACSALQRVLALVVFARSACANFETHLPNAFDIPAESKAWTNAVAPVFARSEAQSFDACCAGVGVANAATGASAKASAMTIMVCFISESPLDEFASPFRSASAPSGMHLGPNSPWLCRLLTKALRSIKFAAGLLRGPESLTPSGRSATLDIEHTFVTYEGGAVLTGRQQEIWDFLVDYVDRHGYPPTVREISDAVGLASPSTVHAHLANLERAGLLRRDPTKPRALELLGGRRREEPPGDRQPRLPLLGQIAAGGPLLAEQNIEDEIGVPEPLARSADFLLRVRGESMVNAGILDGDIVVVRRQPDARDGEIVVALAGDDETADEATVKTFFREDGRVRLQPENAALEPLFPQHVQILGRVVGVFRTL